ncbi:lysozyme-like protein 6 isoform X2 [Tamandua tetradactyla]|uniref:lysozyme-like protein 6 isoform X2 n=1 Tax=Tamandua tetradactyla TaxID=48850 RepID=UPI0040546FE0
MRKRRLLPKSALFYRSSQKALADGTWGQKGRKGDSSQQVLRKDQQEACKNLRTVDPQLHLLPIEDDKSPIYLLGQLPPCGLCLAFVESGFNVSKINENADGSFDYGIFQINSHYWCNDYQSHTENLCHVDCQELLDSNLLAAINCAKKIVSAGGGMNNWIEWKLHCLGRPLSYWMTGCHL